MSLPMVRNLFCVVLLLAGLGYPRPTFAKFGDPTPGTGAVITWSLMPTGAASGDGHTITALADFMPAGFETELAAAFQTWSEVADVTFLQVPDTGPTGSDVRIGGHSISDAFAHGYYPIDPANRPTDGDVHFDTDTTWILEGTGITQGGTEQNVYGVFLHELGHSVMYSGHPGGVFSVVNAPPSTSAFTRELMPYDVQRAQYLYGPAPGYQPPPSANAALALTSNSHITLTFTALEGLVNVSDTAELTGTIEAYLDHSTPGSVSQFAVRDAMIDVGDLLGQQISPPLMEMTVGLTNSDAWLYSTKDVDVAADGSFDPGGTFFGFTDGLLSFDIRAFGDLIDASGSRSVYSSPLGVGVLDDLLAGDLTLTPTGNPNEFLVLLQIPIEASVTIDASLFLSNLNPGDLAVTATVAGLVEATGTITHVPEPSSPVLIGAAMVLASLFVATRRRPTPHASQ